MLEKKGLEQKKGRQEEDKDQITSLPFVNENAQKKKQHYGASNHDIDFGCTQISHWATATYMNW